MGKATPIAIIGNKKYLLGLYLPIFLLTMGITIRNIAVKVNRIGSSIMSLYLDEMTHPFACCAFPFFYISIISKFRLIRYKRCFSIHVLY